MTSPANDGCAARVLLAVLGAGTLWIGLGTIARADTTAPLTNETSVIKDHRIGFVETGLGWSIYRTGDGSKECPQGLNVRTPRDNFNALFPNGGSVADTQLAREALKIFPQDEAPQYPFFEVQGDVAIGLNLDGKVGPRDFVSPDGEPGIDNAFFRATGCTKAFHPGNALGAIGSQYFLAIPAFAFNRMMIEISAVDNLQDAANVEVTIYRGRDPWLIDATGLNVVSGGSQRVDDTAYGEKLIQRLHGRIQNGVLNTDPVNNGMWAWELLPHVPRVLRIHDMRLRLKLSPANADMILAGYFDVDSIYRWMTSYPTHYLNYAFLDASEFYWAMRRNADAYPDQNGTMTAISSAITVNMSQVYVIHANATAGRQVAAIHGP